MRYLCIDASSDVCSVTLSSSQKRFTLKSIEKRSHAQAILPFVDELLSTLSLTLAQLDFIACSQGPGSFTGLRIGFSIAQSLAFAAKLPMSLYCSLQCLALCGWEKYNDIHIVVSVMDARMDQVYWSVNLVKGRNLVCIREPSLDYVDDFVREIQQFNDSTDDHSNVAVVGSGAELLRGRYACAFIDQALHSNSDMACNIVEEMWANGVRATAAQAELVYLRENLSWKKRQRIRHSAENRS